MLNKQLFTYLFVTDTCVSLGNISEIGVIVFEVGDMHFFPIFSQVDSADVALVNLIVEHHKSIKYSTFQMDEN